MTLFSSHKGQHIAEYVIIISLVSAALIAIQTYVKRGLQGRYRDATDSLVSALGSGTLQYEPYYFETMTTTAYNSTRQEQLYSGGAKDASFDQSSTRGGQQLVLPAGIE